MTDYGPQVRWYQRLLQDPAVPRCPECGATEAEHALRQAVANRIRADYGLPPLDPPNIHTGHHRRGAIT